MDVEGKDGYHHGGDPLKDLVRFNLPKRQIIDFSASLNPLGVSQIIRHQWPELLDAVRDYPTIEGQGIAGFYRDKFGISPENVLAGNGSTELIYLIQRMLRPKRVLIITPSFHDYYRASVLSGADVVDLPLSDKNGFSSIDAETLADACKDVDAVWLGRPNNPTGTSLPREALIDLTQRFSYKWFIIDEAFIQFMNNWEEESFIFGKRPANMIIIHSLTKFYCLAGLRMGGVIGSKDIISRLMAIKEPWTINGIADKAASLLKACSDYESQTRTYVSMERERVIKKLNVSKGIITFPSSTNFILCRWTRTGDLDDLLRRLLSNGMYVRDCRNFPGLEDNYFRIGLRTSEENDRLISLISLCKEN